MCDTLDSLGPEISACRLCADRFAATATAHQPRPVFWLAAGARILVAGQAPGARVQASGVPFDDASGDRLRDWMGLDRTAFYDREKIAILPMAFCFPGYDARGADLPPPRLCAATWHTRVMQAAGHFDVILLVGGHAQKWHMPAAKGVTETVRNWRAGAPAVFTLPHPSWRNTGWLKANPWFTAGVLPALRAAVAKALKGQT